MKVLFLFIVLFVAVSSDMAGECNMSAFYLELGCTPIPSVDNTTICPDAFKCPDLHPDPTMCYYRGASYTDRSPLPQNLIKNPCSQACSCRISDGEPQFDCAAVDCVESFDSDLQECVKTYELDSCCSTANVCGKDAIAALKTCQVDGKTYREGEIFEPQNTRKTCICTSDWSGSADNSAYCRDIDCGLEIHYQDKIFDNCAPIFAGNGRSCPIGFECPSTTTKVMRGLNLRSVSAQCVFGNQTLSVGDEITVGEQCTTCICEVPPFVSCLRQNAC
ncbi:uncharacterized protein LOC114253067 [Bombyx mandarina]|uniref:Uncharacterized protein n=2 Tax=Bombyx TaxID=7090 RepID=A0A8R2QXW4_BOMMO|nr:uncharacterized protein LOC114253067 [Bombyx mandarina]XP_037867576.1 uncharacterized protein LOC101741051 [Bombyx mori]